MDKLIIPLLETLRFKTQKNKLEKAMISIEAGEGIINSSYSKTKL
jgi:hypothetical protein